jgi:hypothetical protein
MIIRINHPDISGNEKTLLTATCAAGDSTLTVQNIDGFSVGDYLVLGTLGNEQTEIVRIHTSTAPSGSTITLNAATTFNHAINTPATYIAFNQVALYSASAKGGSYTIVGSATALEVDQGFTEIDDTSGTTSTWYKTRYYNSSTTTWSSYSGEIPGTGYKSNTLKKIIDKASVLADDREHDALSLDEKIDFVNDGYEQAINRLDKSDHKRFVKKAYVDVANSYDTGSVAITDGDTAVTGTGTTWDVSWTGKKIIFGNEGFPYEISSVDSTTGITLTRAYNGAGSNLSGSSYKIFQDEYTIYLESDGVALSDFKKIEQVADEDGNIVNEYDMHRTENGYYLKRDGSNLKFCLNYQPSTSGSAGKWTLWYRYQPTKLTDMEDEPEFPSGYSDVLVSFLKSKIKEYQGDASGAKDAMAEYFFGVNKMIGQANPRTNEKKGFRIDRNLKRGYEHDQDWRDDVYSRDTITGTQFS